MTSPNETHPCPCIDTHLEHLYAASAVIGLLASAIDEPDDDRIIDRALSFGKKMAARARRGRKRARTP